MPIKNDKKLSENKTIRGYLTQYEGQSFYCIDNYDAMPPFLMCVVSSGDLWMYISSNGGLTAGRQNYNNALFPYETDDKLHDAHMHSGSVCLMKEIHEDNTEIWQPFSKNYHSNIQRRLLKSASGTSLVFEETNNCLELKFTYSWNSCENLGWVRKVKIENLSEKARKLKVCDGLRNILPWGIQRETQSMMSTLMDAYKQAKWDEKRGIALFYLSSIPVDRAEPAEALRTQSAWYCGNYDPVVSLNNDAPDEFIKNGNIKASHNIRGKRASFILQFTINLKPMDSTNWYQIIDTAKDHYDLEVFQDALENEMDHALFIENSIDQTRHKLEYLVELADGLQISPDKINDQRHFNNTLFNIMRGGIFRDVYQLKTADFILHIKESNLSVYEKHQLFFQSLKETINLDTLMEQVNALSDDKLLRLTMVYLPLSFGRRHGDPSRPWNFFDVKVKNEDGSPVINYQGNWRDIFQNWEALGFSFPRFVLGMIARFLNATTADGYNPYMITRNGYDWEVPEPNNPWAYIGYWGDHQIVYMHRLLIMQEKYFPGSILDLLDQPIFAYARVPYIIRSYDEMLENPRDTIVFDKDLHEELLERRKLFGSDGLLMSLSDEKEENTLNQPEITGLDFQLSTESKHSCNVYQVNLLEKLLVTTLTKVGSFIPGAGLWLNTQRPEWNDANNALVGYGASMVSLFQLRSFVMFFNELMKKLPEKETFTISSEVAEFFADISQILLKNSSNYNSKTSLLTRKNMSEQLGRAAEKYRNKAYSGFSGKKSALSVSDCKKVLKHSLGHFDATIHSNRREDGLFHAYNLMEWNSEQILIHRLPLMLEGQVAILGCNILDARETCSLLDNLFKSSLYRADQESFMLYPDKSPGSFYDRNNVDIDSVKESPLLEKLLEQNNHEILRKSSSGNLYFNARLSNARVLQESLAAICKKIQYKLSSAEKEKILSIYESVFNHRYFTGRSGSFFKYEGLGSIYWHQVSKLLLAMGENIIRFTSNKDSADEKYVNTTLKKENNNMLSNKFHQNNEVTNCFSDEVLQIKEFYFKIKKGIGAHKQPSEYGAIPTDPYSHTPSGMGAQQPGMTGQVKEDFLSRFLELGLHVEDGKIHFNPVLFTRFKNPDEQVSFTFCGCSITIRVDQQLYIPRLIIKFNQNKKQVFQSINEAILHSKNSLGSKNKSHLTDEEYIIIPGLVVPEDISELIFKRDGSVMEVQVYC